MRLLPDGFGVAGGEGVVPPEAYEAVRRRLDETPAAGRPRIPVHRGLERDRAYYVVALTDLHPAAVLPPIPESAEPAELRFEVER